MPSRRRTVRASSLAALIPALGALSLGGTPARAQVLIPGVLGMTTGRFERRWVGTEGKPQHRKGTYVTIWKKQPDGAWKVVFDTGSPDPPQPVL